LDITHGRDVNIFGSVFDTLALAPSMRPSQSLRGFEARDDQSAAGSMPLTTIESQLLRALDRLLADGLSQLVLDDSDHDEIDKSGNKTDRDWLNLTDAVMADEESLAELLSRL
jgi:hypothetical protein